MDRTALVNNNDTSACACVYCHEDINQEAPGFDLGSNVREIGINNASPQQFLIGRCQKLIFVAR